jgi:serine phosphatase RsbU (regulator of sigma subunit)
MAQRLGRTTADGNGAAVGTADAVEGEDAMQRAETADAAGKTAAGKVAAEKTAAGKTAVTATADTAGSGPTAQPSVADRARSVSPEGSDGRRPRGWRRRRRAVGPVVPAVQVTGRVDEGPELDLASNDPLVGYLLSEAATVDITALELDSPALEKLKAAGVSLVVPLISSGNLIGLVNLGPRLSERDYSSEDRRLLNALAGYAGPAMRVGQLVRQQQAEARNRERIEQELKIAQIIQQQFLPKSVPDLPSWHVAAFYRPARTVGGDFYDFIELPDGRVMFVVGDVTDKGIPAALVMASTHALLRSTAPRLISPGAVLTHVNDLLCADIPAHMFVTCLALVLDPASGQIEFANAGHDVPYVRTAGGVAELRARGMPLGLMPGMDYEEKSFRFQPGDCALLHSDGLAEAHAPDREMFGFPRVAELTGRGASGEELIDLCLTELGAFTGPDAEQEDDITLVSLQRSMSAVYAGGDT